MRWQLDAIPLLKAQAWNQQVKQLLGAGGRLGALFLVPSGPVVALCWQGEKARLLGMTAPADGHYPSLSVDFPQCQAFERELWEDHGFFPDDHPWLKPLRRHAELEEPGQPVGWEGPASTYSFYKLNGAHEVAVGPVHAGIIEPGHFRFQCDGERVLHLEIQLGYQHRGVEKMLLESTQKRQQVIAEAIAGDTAIGHSWAWCKAKEALCGVVVPERGEALRGVALELERLANHVGDLGMLCNDIGFLPGASWFGRYRGDFLNLLVELSGNRLGKGFCVPGGVRRDVLEEELVRWVTALDRLEQELKRVASVCFEEPSVQSRFDGTGVLGKVQAATLGVVGMAARASWLGLDARSSRMGGVYQQHPIPVVVESGGDVRARAMVRWREILLSLGWLHDLLSEFPEGPVRAPMQSPAAESIGLGLVEGWRGEIVHLLTTDSDGQLCSVKVIDPSFHNWPGLALAMREEQISDFPLCNKSFNLSYAGHDL